MIQGSEIKYDGLVGFTMFRWRPVRTVYERQWNVVTTCYRYLHATSPDYVTRLHAAGTPLYSLLNTRHGECLNRFFYETRITRNAKTEKNWHKFNNRKHYCAGNHREM